MSAETLSAGVHPASDQASTSALTPPIVAAFFSWIVMSVGFFGLKMLMEERPEFIGAPLRVTKAELIQESPQIVTRKVSDDISVVRASQPIVGRDADQEPATRF